MTHDRIYVPAPEGECPEIPIAAKLPRVTKVTAFASWETDPARYHHLHIQDPWERFNLQYEPNPKQAEWMLVFDGPPFPGFPLERQIYAQAEPDAISAGVFKRVAKKLKLTNARRLCKVRPQSTLTNPKFLVTRVIPKRRYWGLPEKSKRCSVVASAKMWVPGHRWRVQTVQWLLDHMSDIDAFGRIPHPRSKGFIADKVDALKDYEFTIAIENTKELGYSTEKITDGIMMGCNVFYYGNPQLSFPGVTHMPDDVKLWPEIINSARYDRDAVAEAQKQYWEQWSLPVRLVRHILERS